MKLISIAVCLLSVFSLLSAAEAESYDQALKMATKLDKPILIDFWSDN
jgi:hypothetical protein